VESGRVSQGPGQDPHRRHRRGREDPLEPIGEGRQRQRGGWLDRTAAEQPSDMATPHRVAPEDPLRGLDPLEAAGVGPGVADVLALLGLAQALARLAARVAEVAVVEEQHGEAGLPEALGDDR
jgi:hypothetical protein